MALISDPSVILNSMVEQNDNYRFIQYLTQDRGQTGSIFLDISHLSQSPLDTSKADLEDVRLVLANPYVLVGLMAIAFALIARYTLRKGELFGKY